MNIDNDVILKLETLARLKLEPKERTDIQKDLNAMVKMIDTLDDLDLTDVEPLRHISISEDSLREDLPENQNLKEKALQLAPKSDSDYFLVPKFLKK